MSEASGPFQLEPAAPAAKVDILGTPISQSSYVEVLRCLEQPAIERGRLPAFRNVHWVRGWRGFPPRRRTPTSSNPLTAFDLLSGTVPRAPAWIQDGGPEWAYQLRREPQRLWRRYLCNNPAFALMPTAETVRCHAKSGHRD